jgi:hypothetical protein
MITLILKWIDDQDYISKLIAKNHTNLDFYRWFCYWESSKFMDSGSYCSQASWSHQVASKGRQIWPVILGCTNVWSELLSANSQIKSGDYNFDHCQPQNIHRFTIGQPWPWPCQPCQQPPFCRPGAVASARKSFHSSQLKVLQGQGARGVGAATDCPPQPCFFYVEWTNSHFAPWHWVIICECIYAYIYIYVYIYIIYIYVYAYIYISTWFQLN